VNVRFSRPTDTGVLARLFFDTIHIINSVDYLPEQIAAWAPEPADLDHWRTRLSHHVVFVAENDTDVVGFATFEANGHLDHLYVHYRFQRQGVGSALCERVEQEARFNGIHHIFTEASITARPFFEHVGFQMIAPQTVEHRSVTFINFRMEKVLR
jgi:putative acetyltransferase